MNTLGLLADAIVRRESARGGTRILNPAPRTAFFDVEAFYTALDRKRRKLQISKREVLRQAGITTPATMTRLGQGMCVSVETLIALLTWLGETDLAPYIRKEP